MKTLRIVALIALASFLALPAFAEDEGVIQARMAARVAQIDNLKIKQVVGENNKGLLEFQGPKSDEALVAAENADRIAVYKLIAARTKVTPEEVAKRRAAELRDQSVAGVMVQLPNGAWLEK